MENNEITYKEIANFFVAFGNEAGETITNLRLQKLVYYAQAWHLANFETPLFQHDFEAWVHGPVIKDLYHENKKYGFSPIESNVTLGDISKILPEDKFEFVKEVADIYLNFTAYELEKMTHQETPWIQARKGVSEDEICSNVISKESMLEYYASKI